MDTTVRIERSEVVHGEPDQLWSLLSSPAAWSLWPDAAFMFALLEAPTLWFYIGPTRRGVGRALFEIADEIPGSMIRLRTLPTGRQEFTLSVTAGERGTAKASVRVKEVVGRFEESGLESRRRGEIKKWLSAMRAVIEGRARWPQDDIAPDLLRKCLAQPQFNRAERVSASALIAADPATVWDAVLSPEVGRVLGPSSGIHSGRVPGTPRDQAGEMQYFVHRQADGKLGGDIVVASEIATQRSALVHALSPLQFEMGYVLTPESDSGPTELTVTLGWPALTLAWDAEAARSVRTRAAQKTADSYKSLLESERPQPAGDDS